MPAFQTSPGMRDILPPDSARWRRFNGVFADVVESAGYGQIITPLIEDVGVFTRIGEATDVVTKEMYDFVDRVVVTCRCGPELTASVCRVVRAASADDAVEGLVLGAELPPREATAWAATASSTRSGSRCSASTTRTSTSR